MVSRVILETLVYEYVQRSSHRLRGQLVRRHNVAVASFVEMVHLPFNKMDAYELHKAKHHLWEELHSVHWKDVHGLDKELFGLVSCMLVVLLFDNTMVDQSQLLQMLDCGLLLGSEHTHELINKVMSLIRDSVSVYRVSKKASVSHTNQHMHFLQRLQSQRRINNLISQPCTIRKTITTTSVVDLSAFYKEYFQPQVPVVLRNCMDDWPAMRSGTPNESNVRRWGNIDYLLETVGHRTVPIETGATYLSEDSGSRFVTGEQFICEYILGHGHGMEAEKNVCSDASPTHAHVQSLSDASITVSTRLEEELRSLPVGYLAQHRLLDQVPALRRDIITPDYCALLLDLDEVPNAASLGTDDSIGGNQATRGIAGSSKENEEHIGEDVLVNAWLGPIGTVSPLHHDPYYNLLAQTTGYKYVRLYAPDESINLYPMAGRMSNNSEVDLLLPEDELRKRFPLVSTARYEEYILGPGEMLFVPRWWWHFIVAVDRDSAQHWRATHPVPMHSIEAGDSSITSKRSSSLSPTESERVGDAKKRRVALVLPPPQHSQDEMPSDTDDQMHTISHSEVTSTVEKGKDESVDYSFSVSFWWGKRILKG